MVARLVGILVGDVETDVVDTVDLHLLIDGTGHDIARSEREALVVLLHEGFAIGQLKDAAIAAHGLGDEVGGMRLLGIVEHRGVELHKLHIGHRTLGAIHHGDTVARSDDGVGGGEIDGSATACTHDGDLREIGIYLLSVRVEHVSTITLDVRRTTRDAHAQMVLGDDLDGKVILLDVDIGILAHGFHEATLDLGTSVVGMVEDAELGVSTFTMKVKRAVFLLVEVDAPLHKLLDLLGGLAHHLFDGGTVGDIVARNHCVLDVLLEVVELEIRDTGHATLGKRGVGLVERRLTDHAYLALACSGHFEGVTHAGHACSYHEEIILVNHIDIRILLILVQNYLNFRIFFAY